MTVHFTTSKSKQDFQQILDLQNRNVEEALTSSEVEKEGFVSARHSVELLEKMNAPYPHIIAKSNDQIIGFTLVMLRSLQNDIDLLIPLFKNINSIQYNDQLIKNTTYFVMGQVCIEKEFRGKGIFRDLYDELRTQMQLHFEYCITGISVRNIRSWKAHEKIGFKIIHEYTDSKGDWLIVLWDWD